MHYLYAKVSRKKPKYTRDTKNITKMDNESS